MSRVLLVTSEATPFVKTGGLADVLGALPPALAQLVEVVVVVMPAYGAAQMEDAERIRYEMPLMMGPQSISIISFIFFANIELVATFITGQTGLPVGVPNPVVNKMSVAPEAAFPVVASTSLPGVHTRLKPGLVAASV